GAFERTAVGLDHCRLVAELVGRSVLEDQAATIGNRAAERREILARIESRLVREHDARSADERDVGNEFGVEPEIGGEPRLFQEEATLASRLLGDRGVHVAAHPGVVAVDVFVTNDRIYL